MTKKIVVTGGTGRFGQILKEHKIKHKIYINSKYVKKTLPSIIINYLFIWQRLPCSEINI